MKTTFNTAFKIKYSTSSTKVFQLLSEIMKKAELCGLHLEITPITAVPVYRVEQTGEGLIYWDCASELLDWAAEKLENEASEPSWDHVAELKYLLIERLKNAVNDIDSMNDVVEFRDYRSQLNYTSECDDIISRIEEVGDHKIKAEKLRELADEARELEAQ